MEETKFCRWKQSVRQSPEWGYCRQRSESL